MKCLVASQILLPLVSALCYHDAGLQPRSDFSPPSFGYTGLDGPLNWHGIATDNLACAQGTYQSPVAVDSRINSIPMVKGDSLSMELENYLAGAEIRNLGTTVEVAANGTIYRHGKEYRLVQFHLHTPSEHRIDEETYAMEAHFVFRAQGESKRSRPNG